MLSPEEKRRYSRQILLSEIGEAGQEKLKLAKVLVIGAGGLGCPVLLYLSASGVGEIGIVDGDAVDETNLQRQILYTSEDVGKPKAATAGKKIAAQNPFVKINAHPVFLSAENAVQFFSQYDLIVDGSDNFPTRYLVNDACVLADKPFVSGSVFRFEGQVSVFNFRGGPTYRCLFPEPPDPREVPSCAQIGVSPILPGLIGSLQANEVLKIFTGHGEVLSGKLLVLDAATSETRLFRFNKNPDLRIEKLLASYEDFCKTRTTSQVVPEIDFDELQKKASSGEPILLLDIRSAEERKIFGPIKLNQATGRNFREMRTESEAISELIFNELKSLPSGAKVVLYCQRGGRSASLVERLLSGNSGYSLIYSLRGGFEAALSFAIPK